MNKLKKYHPPKGIKRNAMFITFSRFRFNFSLPCIPNLQRKEFCELFHNEEKSIIGIKPYQIENPDSLRISMNEETRTNPSVGCRDFIKRMGIFNYLEKTKKRSVQVDAIWDDKQKAFLLKVDFIKGE